MIKITIETETYKELRTIAEILRGEDDPDCRPVLGDLNKTCRKLLVDEKKPCDGPIWRVTNVGTGEPTEYPDKTWSGSPETNSITAPDMSNVTISGSSAPKKEIPLETVKKYIGMAGTITGAFNEPEVPAPKIPEYRHKCCANCSKWGDCIFQSVRITKEVKDAACQDWKQATDDEMEHNEKIFSEYISKVKELKA